MLNYFGVTPVLQTATAAPQPNTAPPHIPANVASELPVKNGEAAAPALSSGGLALDIFWCVGGTQYPGTNKNEELAQKLFHSLVELQTQEGLAQIRLRRLPELVNQTPLYSIARDKIIIRYNQDRLSEKRQLQGLITEALTKAHSDTGVRAEEAHSRMQQHYLPVYVCSEE
jgi:hypothetical protein